MPGRVRSTVIAASGLAAALIALAVVGAGRPQAQANFYGEYGLWVEDRDSVIHVGWYTRAADRGRLAVRPEGADPVVRTTPTGRVHAASVRRPPTDDRVLLEYGSADDATDRTRTAVRLRPPDRPGVTRDAVDSLYVVGDTHGDFEALSDLLRNAGLIDADRSWAGGRAHLVLLGDLLDRGPDATRLLWFIYRLEREAERAGGRVHVVLGNHEVMVMGGDDRYVSPKERQMALLHGVDYPRLYDPHRSVLGRWLASKPALIRIGDALLAHGGLAPSHADVRPNALDDSLAAFVGEELMRRWMDTTYVVPLDSAAFERRAAFFWGDESVFWYRGYVRADTLGDGLARVLERQGARVHIVAHTPVPSIRERYGGALIAAHPERPGTELVLLARSDTGTARVRYGRSGPPVPLPRDAVAVPGRSRP